MSSADALPVVFRCWAASLRASGLVGAISLGCHLALPRHAPLPRNFSTRSSQWPHWCFMLAPDLRTSHAQRCGSHRQARPQVSSIGPATLPPHWAASVHVVADDARLDVLRFCVLPDAATPYAHGAFLFDMLLPPQFPNAPPQARALARSVLCHWVSCLKLLSQVRCCFLCKSMW